MYHRINSHPHNPDIHRTILSVDRNTSVPFAVTGLLENTMVFTVAKDAKDFSKELFEKTCLMLVGRNETALLIRGKGIDANTADIRNVS